MESTDLTVWGVGTPRTMRVHWMLLELGLEPGRALRDLESAILRQDPSLDAPAAPATPAVAIPRRAPADSAGRALVGRTLELEALLGGLEDACAGRGRTFMPLREQALR